MVLHVHLLLKRSQEVISSVTFLVGIFPLSNQKMAYPVWIETLWSIAFTIRLSAFWAFSYCHFYSNFYVFCHSHVLRVQKVIFRFPSRIHCVYFLLRFKICTILNSITEHYVPNLKAFFAQSRCNERSAQMWSARPSAIFTSETKNVFFNEILYWDITELCQKNLIFFLRSNISFNKNNVYCNACLLRISFETYFNVKNFWRNTRKCNENVWLFCNWRLHVEYELQG
jgi:hypothetical protein